MPNQQMNTTFGRLGQKLVQHFDDILSGNFTTINNANRALGAIGKKRQAAISLTSPLEMASRYYHDYGNGGSLLEAAEQTFLKDVNAGWAVNNINKRKVVGGISGIGIGMGIAGGLTHDSAGNIDIAGIPMI